MVWACSHTRATSACRQQGRTYDFRGHAWGQGFGTDGTIAQTTRGSCRVEQFNEDLAKANEYVLFEEIDEVTVEVCILLRAGSVTVGMIVLLGTMWVSVLPGRVESALHTLAVRADPRCKFAFHATGRYLSLYMSTLSLRCYTTGVTFPLIGLSDRRCHRPRRMLWPSGRQR